MKSRILAIGVVTVMGILTACGGAEKEQNTVVDEGLPAEEEEQENIQTEEEDAEAYKSSCHSFEYKDYFRNEQTYRGEKICVDVRVAQILDGDLRAYDAEGNEYYISDQRGEGDNIRILESDMLTVYGEYGGTEKMVRAIGNYESEVFHIIGKYFELHEEKTEGASDPLGVLDLFGGTGFDNQEESPYYYEEEDMDSYDMDNEYFLPDSDVRLLTEADIEGFSSSDLRIAKNEIYARHGRIFTSEDLDAYFSTKTWYEGTIPGDQFDETVFSQTEKENIVFIQSYMDALSDSGKDYVFQISGGSNGDTGENPATYQELVELKSMEEPYSEYALYDLDHDGTEEVILSWGSGYVDWRNDVFSIVDGEIFCIGTFWGEALLYTTGGSEGLYSITGKGEYRAELVEKEGDRLVITDAGSDSCLGSACQEIQLRSTSDLSLFD